MRSAKGYFDMGYEARYQGLSKEANPLLFGNGWPHEAWNLGFEFAELEIAAPRQSEAVLERVPANPFEQGRNAHIRGIAFGWIAPMARVATKQLGRPVGLARLRMKTATPPLVAAMACCLASR